MNIVFLGLLLLASQGDSLPDPPDSYWANHVSVLLLSDFGPPTLTRELWGDKLDVSQRMVRVVVHKAVSQEALHARFESRRGKRFLFLSLSEALDYLTRHLRNPDLGEHTRQLFLSTRNRIESQLLK